jgi:serine protease Do
MSTSIARVKPRTWYVAGALVALGGLVSARSLALNANPNARGGDAPAMTSAADAPSTPGKSLGESMSKAFRDAARQVLPSVVMITNTPTLVKTSGNSSAERDFADSPFAGTPFGDMFKNNPEFRHYFNFKEFPSTPHSHGHQSEGLGSGVIIDPSGVILTNNHVIAGGGRIMVRLHDGREFKAIEVKGDPKSDLAIVRIRGAGKLQAAQMGDSDKIQVGDWVLALGQPFGLEDTVTAGIISAKGRGIGETARDSFLQTDAAINPGNSGGPLVDLDGRVVGINTAISSNNGGFQGVGFAAPINLAKWVTHQLMGNGTVQRAYLGVAIQPMTAQLAEQLHAAPATGVVVSEVRPDTPASKAGLHSGDVILEFAGRAVSKPWQLQGLVEETNAGSSQKITVLRDGKQLTLDIRPAVQPANYGVAENESNAPDASESPKTSSFDKLGLAVETLTPEVAEQLGIRHPKGVVISHVESGSPADLAGLSEGMVIAQVNRQAVATVAEFRKALGTHPLQGGVLLLVHSKEGSRFVVLRVEE